MATKSFLSTDELKAAAEMLQAPAELPNGDEDRLKIFHSLSFSRWLADKLTGTLSQFPDWQETLPVVLGSWSRDELCPKSDIDLLFCGDESRVKELSDWCHEKGLKLRYRVPQDTEDWQKGVTPFDVLAVLQGKALGEKADSLLKIQREKILREGLPLKRKLLQAMLEERKARQQRFDSISNFLEPNLKYGSGGLRDLQQALVVYELFPEKFKTPPHALKVLAYYKAFFLTVRQKLHLIGGGDILSAPEQLVIGQWMGFAKNQDFMREIQKGLSRVSFYADWIFEYVKSSQKRIEVVEKRKLSRPHDLFLAFQDDPSVLMQNRVRRAADEIFKKKLSAKEKATLAKDLELFISPQSSDEWTVALFRSRLIDQCVPEFRKIVGHVQHDQYHRFSVDAHLLQALRELKRIYHKPKIAGCLASEVKKLDKKDWRILTWSCLYHDIAKGRGSDHSSKGVAVTKEDLQRFRQAKELIEEVCWMVEAHLFISEAAFRKNPRSPSTWTSLNDNGVFGKRVTRLTIFTVVDILATNPEAWTPWKERLLYELATILEAPETSRYIELLTKLEKRKVNLEADYIKNLDPLVIEGVPLRALMTDLQYVQKSTSSLEPLIIEVKKRGREKDTWIRFHSREDRPGLFLEFVEALYHLGCSVRHAAVQTSTEIGVYDWFHVKSGRDAQSLKRLMKNLNSKSPPQFSVRFDQIEMVSQDPQEWIVSFRGKDQQGALIQAARALFEEGVAIRWAKVNTWGRQIDDVFSVASQNYPSANLLQGLRTRLT